MHLTERHIQYINNHHAPILQSLNDWWEKVVQISMEMNVCLSSLFSD